MVVNGELEMCDILKTAGRGAKRSEIWDSRVVVTHIWVHLPCRVQGNFGVIQCIVSK